MPMTDPISDMLARIRNGLHARRQSITCPHSALKVQVLAVLKDEGYIRGYSEKDVRSGIKELTIELKYHNGEPAIKEVERVSTPGRRVYSTIDKMPRHFGGLGIAILSTSHGVMADHVARDKNVGGEVLCRVF
ncbi:MAG: 30S ribosomal protein S8 [Alphaproteobacteria bacterium]